MSWFKRLCLFVFGISCILALGALSLTWVGPWTPRFRSMLELRWFFITLEVLVCISGAGSLICVLMSLFTPRNPRETVVAEVPGGQITVSRAAIASQAKHIVESDGTCVAASVSVRARKRGHVRVFVRVRPRRPIDVIQRGEELYALLAEGLSHVCGDSVQSIDVVFTEPEQMDDSLIHVETASEQAAHEEQPPVPATGDITVPMASSADTSVDEATKVAAPEHVQEDDDEAEQASTESEAVQAEETPEAAQDEQATLSLDVVEEV
ncbi:MAG: alkaline shock response membrane anchor protein AmaP [Coriobacteriales bacterium]|nr:alkaline shock response membrane anchor protein AmaP [Coriobacteriales bacterium]